MIKLVSQKSEGERRRYSVKDSGTIGYHLENLS